jgi:hypothetical protein
VQIILKFDAEKHEIVLPAMLPQAAQGQRPTESA